MACLTVTLFSTGCYLLFLPERIFVTFDIGVLNNIARKTRNADQRTLKQLTALRKIIGEAWLG
jgi:hypothetical protein